MDLRVDLHMLKMFPFFLTFVGVSHEVSNVLAR